MKRFLPIIFIAFLSWSCSSAQRYIAADAEHIPQASAPKGEHLVFKVFLIGDAGAPASTQTEPTLRLLKAMLDTAGPQSATIFLGDNIYPSGMPGPDSPARAEAERRITEQLKTVEQFKGRIVFIPGNHDWNNDGSEAVQRQEKFVENYLSRGNTFLPDQGFPGPADVELVDETAYPELCEDIRLLVLDTQWWLQKNNKPFGNTGEYLLDDTGDFLAEIDSALATYKNDHLLVVGHHPVFSNGNHGGYFPLKAYVWPPVAGLFFTTYRKIFGLPQDLSFRRYRLLRKNLTRRFAGHKNLIYASGHEHNLQYFLKTSQNSYQHYIVSGSGSKDDYVAGGHGARFVSDQKGFAVISYYSGGSGLIEFWVPENGGKQGRVLFRTPLH